MNTQPQQIREQVVHLPDAESTRAYGRALARVLRAGDLVVLTGDLGAGKTTLTQGIGAGLGVRGQVASPTFIIARVHPPADGGDGLSLVHVDAYRIGSLDEIDALDLDTSLEESVTVVEWGEGLVEQLAQDRLEIALTRPHGADAQVPVTGDPDPDAAESAADPGQTVNSEPTFDPEQDASAGTRTLTIRAIGSRWRDADLPDVPTGAR